MQGIIAVEESLSNIVGLLEEQGYEVISLNDTRSLENVDAVVVSGSDNNVMNMQNIATDVPVINAAGKSPEEILEAIARL